MDGKKLRLKGLYESLWEYILNSDGMVLVISGWLSYYLNYKSKWFVYNLKLLVIIIFKGRFFMNKMSN